MPSCAILQCKNRSVHRNVSNAGISYHRFPNDPAIQAKWIAATGRVNWIPAKSSTICSEHFDDKDLQTSKKGYKYLSDTAVPVKKILIYQCKKDDEANLPEPTKQHFETVQLPSYDSDVPIKKSKDTPPESPTIIDENKGTPDLTIPQTPRNKNLVSMLQWTQSKIRKQILKIKRIQAQNRRLRNKNKMMEAMVLKNENNAECSIHSVTIDGDVGFKAEEQESTNCDYGEPAALKVCRICLATDVKLFPIRIYKQAYEHLTGISTLEEDRLPQKLCVECAQRLLNCSRFRHRSVRANSLMMEILKKQEHLTLQNIKTINRENNQLTSSLATKHYLPNHYDAYEYYTEPDTLPIIPEEKTLPIDTLTPQDLQLEIKQENEIFIPEDVEEKNENNLIIDEGFDKDFYASDNNYSSDDSLPLKIIKPETKVKKKREPKVKKPVKRVKKVKEPAEPKIDRRRKPFLNDDLNETLFTITDLSFDEQIAEILKRQDSSNYKNAVFKCTACFKGFLDEDAYNAHITRHTNQSGEHECEICKTHFKHPHALRKHITAHHTQRFSCKQCTYVTTHRQTARLHERWHNGTKYSCPHCQHEFLKFTTYMGHIRIKHPSDFVCEICGYSFVSAKGIELHKKLKHRLDNVQVPEDGPFCEMCNVRFVSVEAHKRHLSVSAKHNTGTDKDARESNKPKKGKRTKEIKDMGDKSEMDLDKDSDDKKKMYPSQIRKAEGPIPCEQCGLQLEDSRAYHGHFRRMHPDKNRTNYPSMKSPCMCEVCGRMFQSYALLKDHTWVHTGQRPFSCDSCGKAFRMKQRLVAHRRVHSQARATYVCALCGKHFSTHSNRQRHMFIHTGLKPYKCEMCGKGFKHASEKRAHITYVHLKKPWPKRARGKRRPDTRQAGAMPQQHMDLPAPIWGSCDPKLNDDLTDMMTTQDKPVYYNLKI